MWWWCTHCGNLCEYELTKQSLYRCKGCGWIYTYAPKASEPTEHK